jgi:hypothetical protein
VPHRHYLWRALELAADVCRCQFLTSSSRPQSVLSELAQSGSSNQQAGMEGLATFQALTKAGWPASCATKMVMDALTACAVQPVAASSNLGTVTAIQECMLLHVPHVPSDSGPVGGVVAASVGPLFEAIGLGGTRSLRQEVIGLIDLLEPAVISAVATSSANDPSKLQAAAMKVARVRATASHLCQGLRVSALQFHKNTPTSPLAYFSW